MADGGGRVPVAAEVPAFERHVGGDDDLVAAGRGEDGAVVADAEAEGAGAAGGDGSALANAFNPGEFPFGVPADWRRRVGEGCERCWRIEVAEGIEGLEGLRIRRQGCALPCAERCKTRGALSGAKVVPEWHFELLIRVAQRWHDHLP